MEVVEVLAVVDLDEELSVGVSKVHCHDCERHLDNLDRVFEHPASFVSERALEKAEITYFNCLGFELTNHDCVCG